MTETLNWDHTMVDVTNLQDAIDYLKNYKPSELDVDKNAIYAR